MSDSKRIPKHVFDAMHLYIKYRYSHLEEKDLIERKEKTLKALREATPEEQEQYVEKVNAFLETNKDLIQQVKESSKNAEYQARLKETMSRNWAQ